MRSTSDTQSSEDPMNGGFTRRTPPLHTSVLHLTPHDDAPQFSRLDTRNRGESDEAGGGFERFALTATTLGIRTAMINEPIEVASSRNGFAGRVNPIARFGYAPELRPRVGMQSAASGLR